ncbi:non-specific serine/threonine protein kinase [Entamoeba marina]
MSTYTAGTRITSPLGNVYIVHGLISRGGFSSVYKAHLHPDRDNLFALKIIDKRKVHGKLMEHLQREISIAKEVSHPNLLMMKEVIQTQVQLLMVLEYVDGGELFELLKSEGILSLQQNIRILRQICEATTYLHSLKISHRDIKPENILCTQSEEPFDVKLADFGLSKQFREEFLTTSCGTLHYAAPEIVSMSKNYSEACDMWSIGVLTFVLLTGSFPFDGPIEDVKKKICNGEVDWKRIEEKEICEEAIDFMKKLLNTKQDERLTAEESLNHPFLHILDVEKDIEIPLDVLDCLDLE